MDFEKDFGTIFDGFFLTCVVRNFVVGRALPNVIWIYDLFRKRHVGIFKHHRKKCKNCKF